jgi:hypothetical protein
LTAKEVKELEQQLIDENAVVFKAYHENEHVGKMIYKQIKRG